MSANISKYNAEQLGTNIVEVTAHAGARPDHAKWQGGWYSLSGKDKRYKDLRTETGYGTGAGLMGWNCRHSFFPVIPGIDEPKYTKEQLENIDPPPKEIDGEIYTYYEAEQQQRYMERIMRKTKRELVVLQAAGDEEQFIWRSILLRGETEEYVDFCEKAGLIPRPDRYGAVGYGRVISSKAKWSVRKAESRKSAEAAVTKTPRCENGRTAVVSVSSGSNGGTGKMYYSEKILKKGLTNNIINDKIGEREYGVRYEEHSINAKMDYINSKEYENKFKNATNNEAVNKTLLECSRSAIKHRTGTKFEDMYIINADTGEIMGSQLETKSEQGVAYNDSIQNALDTAKNKNIPIVALHTHPEGLPPSIDDFNKAFENNYLMGFVAGHNGQLYRYQNKKAYFKNANDIHSHVVFMYKGGADADRAYKTIYEELDITYDILRGDE